MENLNELAKNLVNLSVKDVKQLGDILKDKYGIEPAAAAAPVMVASAVVEEKEEQTIFDVELQSVGSSKLGVIKLVKTILSLGLKEAKELVDSAPVFIKRRVDKGTADKFKADLEGVGAKVVLK